MTLFIHDVIIIFIAQQEVLHYLIAEMAAVKIAMYVAENSPFVPAQRKQPSNIAKKRFFCKMYPNGEVEVRRNRGTITSRFRR